VHHLIGVSFFLERAPRACSRARCVHRGAGRLTRKEKSAVTGGRRQRNAKEWITIVRRYMDFCFRVSSVPRVGELASLIAVSREELTRSFRAATGRSPAATFRAIQLRRAMNLLANSDRSTADIARAAAYGSVRAFYRAFFRSLGVTPTAYRLRLRRSRR
jgi:AraC-like DNA-binding protein